MSGPVSIYELSNDSNALKKKIAKNLDTLNKSSLVFDEMIMDYNVLYQKYISIQSMYDRNQRVKNIQLAKDKEKVSNMDKGELEKAYNTLKEEYLNLKNEKEETLVKLTKNLQMVMDLKGTKEQMEKKITALSTENGALKQQNITLEKKNKELNQSHKTQEEELKNLKEAKQKLEADKKKLEEGTKKLYLDIEKMRNKLLQIQENRDIKLSNYEELMKMANEKMKAADAYFSQKEEKFVEENKDNKNLNEMFSNSEEVKIPNKLKYKQKWHNKVITSINFNNFGSSFISTGADYIVRVYDAAKNVETNVFSGFSSSVSEACFDHTEQLVFAGSLDKTAKLWALKNNKLINTFTGHIDYINCVKTFNAKQHGLTGSSDRTIREWDFTNKKMVRRFSCISACHCLAISPDDSCIYSGHMDGTVKVWDSNDKPQKVFDLHDDKVLQIKMIKSDQILTLGKDETIKLFDLRKEQPIYTIDDSKIPQYCESSIALSSDFKYFAVGSTKGTIYIVNLKEGTIDSTINNKSSSPINGLCWRPFNSQIYVGDSTGYITIWGTGGK